MLKEGQILKGRYRLLAKRGEGGFGTVFHAMDLSLNREVAIKVLKNSTFQVESDIERFKQEARLLSRMMHRNIVTVYGIDLLDGGIPIIVMEYLTGRSLQNLLLEHPSGLSLERCNLIFRQVCAGLAYAHKMSLIHRDLSPANIFLLDDPEPTVKIIDFGLAKLISSEGGPPGNAWTLTKTGNLIGNPAYMSPEQCRGEKLDARADIYSAGCVLYQMLTGRMPYVADNPVALLYLQQNEYPQEPQLSWEDRASAGMYKYIALRSLQKDKHNRFESMERILECLDNPSGNTACFRAGFTHMDRWGSSYRQDGGQIRVNCAPLWKLALLALFGISVSVYTYGNAIKSNKPSSLTGLGSRVPENIADGEPRVKRLLRLLGDKDRQKSSYEELAKIAYRREMSNKYSESVRLNESAKFCERVLARLKESTVPQSSNLIVDCSITLAGMYEVHHKTEFQQLCYSLCQTDPATLDNTVFRDLINFLLSVGRYKESRQLCELALKSNKYRSENSILLLLGDCCLLQRNFSEAEKYYERSELVSGEPDESRCHHALLKLLQGKYGEAEELCKNLDLSSGKELDNALNPLSSISLASRKRDPVGLPSSTVQELKRHILYSTYIMECKWSKAKELNKSFSRSGIQAYIFDIFRLNNLPIPFASYDKQTVKPLFLARSASFRWRGQPATALSECNKVIQIDSNDAYAYRERAAAYLQMRNFEKARADLDRLVKLAHSDSTVYVSRAEYYRSTGQQERAIVDCNRAIESCKVNLSESDRRTNAWSYIKRADNYGDLRQHDRAIADCNTAISIAPARSDALYWAYLVRARNYGDLEQNSKAIADCNNAIQIDPKNQNAYVYRAKRLRELGEMDKALADHTTAINLDPSNPAVYTERAEFYSSMGKLDSAVCDDNRAIELNPTLAPLYAHRSSVYRAQKLLDKALADANTAVSLAPWDEESYRARSECFKDLGNFPKAIADSNRSIKQNPWNGEVYRVRAECFKRFGYPEKAMQDYKQAITLNPKDKRLYAARAKCYRLLGLDEKALADEENSK